MVRYQAFGSGREKAVYIEEQEVLLTDFLKIIATEFPGVPEDQIVIYANYELDVCIRMKDAPS